MSNSPDTSAIQEYLKDLQLAYEASIRTCNEQLALKQGAQKEFDRKNNYFLQIKACWERIVASNDLAQSANVGFASISSLSETLKEKVCLNLYALQHLNKEIKDFCKKIEVYTKCICDLNMEIDAQIKEDKGLQEGAIIKSLKELEAAYLDLKKCMVKALCELVEILEYTFIFKCRLTGLEDGQKTDKCIPGNEGGEVPPGKTYGCPPDPMNPAPELCRPEEGFFEGFCDSVEKIKTDWEKKFPFFSVNDSGDYQFKTDCAYFKDTKENFDKALADRIKAQENLTKRCTSAELAQAQKESVGKSVEAAQKAKKC